MTEDEVMDVINTGVVQDKETHEIFEMLHNEFGEEELDLHGFDEDWIAFHIRDERSYVAAETQADRDFEYYAYGG